MPRNSLKNPGQHTPRQLFLVCAAMMLAALGWAHGAEEAALRCPNVFGSNMVLQRRKPVPLWGWASPGAMVTVSFAGQDKNGTAGPDGRWAVALDPMEANATGQTLVVRAGQGRIEMTDVLVGEVWLASGQSNMAFVLAGSSMPNDVLKNLDKQLIRILAVNEAASLAPLDDLKGEWLVLDAKSASRASGVASYFAMCLQDQLQIPIGILSSSRGGTRIETWTPAEGFDLVPELKEQADQVRALQAEAERTGNRKGGHPKWTPAVQYNAMIHPMVGTALRGAIWYQGESNTGDELIYEQKMHALVGGLRGLWKQGEFPFYFV